MLYSSITSGVILCVHFPNLLGSLGQTSQWVYALFQIKERYGPNLDSLQTGHTVGVMVDDQNCLHLEVNGLDQGVAARDIPHVCYVVADLYGQCQQVCNDIHKNISDRGNNLDFSVPGIVCYFNYIVINPQNHNQIILIMIITVRLFYT